MNLISSFSDYTRNRRKEVYMNVCVQCLLRVDHQLIIKSRKKKKTLELDLCDTDDSHPVFMYRKVQ